MPDHKTGVQRISVFRVVSYAGHFKALVENVSLLDNELSELLYIEKMISMSKYADETSWILTNTCRWTANLPF
jgi:hypothetical protein